MQTLNVDGTLLMKVKGQENSNTKRVKSENKSLEARNMQSARLPCRGCIASCKNYDHCDGKLWRMTE